MASTSTGSNKRPPESESNVDAAKRLCQEEPGEENEFDVANLPSSSMQTNEHGIFNV